MMDKKGLEQYTSHTLRTNKQKALDKTAFIEEMKEEDKQEYVFIYWDEWR